MIDRQLNYGRESIASFLKQCAPFGSVVDLGAGGGHDLDLAAIASPEATRYAIETYAPSVESLKLRHKVISLNLEQDVLPFDDESIDIVMSNQVLEHTKEIFWIFHQATRVLRVGGHMIIGVPNLASFHNRILLLAGRQPTSIQNHSAHVRGYTKHDLLRTFEMIFPGGYELQGFSGANFYPFPAMIAKPLARVFPNSAWGIFLLLKKVRPYNEEFLFHPIDKQLETNFYLADARERASTRTSS